MKIAFHFRVDPEEHGNVYGQAIDTVFLKQLRAFEGHELHAEMFHGDLLVTKFTKDESANEEMLRALLGTIPENGQPSTGRNLRRYWFLALFTSSSPMVCRAGFKTISITSSRSYPVPISARLRSTLPIVCTGLSTINVCPQPAGMLVGNCVCIAGTLTKTVKRPGGPVSWSN